MDFEIVAKGAEVAVKDKAGQTFANIYVGAGWDMAEGNAPVDLDLVAACLSGGKITDSTRLVYFNDRDEPGVHLSEDNRTGAGDGDDENLLINLSQVEADVDSIAIGVVAYANASFDKIASFKFRVVSGQTASDPQVFEVSSEGGQDGDTVLHAVTLKRGAEGWTLENVSTFHKCGNGTEAVKGFAKLFA